MEEKKEIDQLSISSGDHTLGGTESDEESPAWVNLKESIDFHVKCANENCKILIKVSGAAQVALDKTIENSVWVLKF